MKTATFVLQKPSKNWTIKSSNMIAVKNIFKDLPKQINVEFFEDLIHDPNFKLERIISFGQASPKDEWYDQERNEWVILLKGSATLVFEGKSEEIELRPGDHLLIPAHQKHRVSRTDPDEPSFWLALHFDKI